MVVFNSECRTLNFSINDAINNFNLPEIKSCVDKTLKLKYISEGEIDYWQFPDETEARKAGDCKEQSFYLQKCLEKNKIHSEVIFGYACLEDFLKDNKGHSWVELEKDGITYVIDIPRGGGFIAARHTLDITEYMHFPEGYSKPLERKIKEYKHTLKSK